MKRYDYNGKPGTKYWRLTVVYDLDHHEWGSVDTILDELLGQCDGAGTGFGERDMDWAFADKASGTKALKLVKSLKLPETECHLDEIVEEVFE